jgi:chemotaxis protein MotB
VAKKDDEKQPIIIKKVKKGGGGHHGGAWKVAYADFVTAMMAFFLLLWLLNVTTAQQKDLISSYFAPTDPRVSQSTSGSGGVMGGKSQSPEGAMTSDRSATVATSAPEGAEGKKDDTTEDDTTEPPDEKQTAEMDKQDEKAFQAAEDKIKQAIESIPELKELAQNLLIDMTPEGLRIQIIDQEGKPMFESGSAKALPQTERLLRLISQVVTTLPNKISIRGHTDAKQYGKNAAYTNWELSADRANTSRRILLGSGIGMGLDPDRIENVQGKADREPLVANDPDSPKNRRISVILLKQSIAPVGPAKAKPLTTPSSSAPPAPVPKKREEGVIYFP